MRKDQQYATSFWTQFLDPKSNLFYSNYYTRDQNVQLAYLVFMSVLQSTILHFIHKQHGYTGGFITLIGTMFAALLVSKVNRFQNVGLLAMNLLNVVDTLNCEGSPLIKVLIILSVLTLRNLVSHSTWIQHAFENLLHMSVVLVHMAFYGKLDLHSGLEVILIATLGQSLMFVSIATVETRLKKLWVKYEQIRKSYQQYVDMLFDLPVPIFIVNMEGDIVMQNYLSYRILPRDINIVKHTYSDKQTTIDSLLVSPDDLKKFKETIHQTFVTNQMNQLEASLNEHPFPMLYYFKRVSWKRQPGVQVTCVELSEFQSYLFHNINQFSMQAINSAQNLAANKSQNHVDRQPSVVLVGQNQKPPHHKIKTYHTSVEEVKSEEDCSILRKELTFVKDVASYSYEPIRFQPPQPGHPTSRPHLSEEEKMIRVEPQTPMTPISNLFEKRTAQQQQRQSSAPHTDGERYDVEEKINKYMHHIEKGVSRTLENILAEIMTHKGKKVNIHFKRKSKGLRNYETSPESSEAVLTPQQRMPEIQEHQREQKLSQMTQKELKRPSIFKPQVIPSAGTPQFDNRRPEKDKALLDFPSIHEMSTPQLKSEHSQGKLIEPLTPPVKKQSQQQQQKNKFVSALRNLREDDVQPAPLVQPSPKPIPQMAEIPEANEPSPVFQGPSGQKNVLKQMQDSVAQQRPQWTEQPNYSFQVIASPQPPPQSVEPIPEEESRNCSVELQLPKFRFCDKVTYMVVDDFVFVLNSATQMKLDYERTIISDNKGSVAIDKFKAHLNEGNLFHFLMIDFVMEKDWSGYKLVEEIRNFEKSIDAPPSYIIGMDSDITDKKLEDAKQKGFDDAVEKPLKPAMVNGIIASRLLAINS